MSKPGPRSQKCAPPTLGIIPSSEMHILMKLSPWEEGSHMRGTLACSQQKRD